MTTRTQTDADALDDGQERQQRLHRVADDNPYQVDPELNTAWRPKRPPEPPRPRGRRFNPLTWLRKRGKDRVQEPVKAGEERG